MAPVTSLLTVDLAAIRANYHFLKARHAHAAVAAVVKADAYGLGMTEVARALSESEGCTTFFVATLAEAVALRAVLPNAAIHVFEGPQRGDEQAFGEYRLCPVINSLEQLHRWIAAGGGPSALHVDTGMCRLGLSIEDVRRFDEPMRLPKAAGVELLMSHLACASDPSDPMNEAQLALFNEARGYFPGIPASLANSSGHFLSRAYHYDLGRPGCALYGITPNPALPNPMRPVAEWRAPILQIRKIEREQPIGYGATETVTPGMKVATVACGYADGLHRVAAGRFSARIGGHACHLLGHVSMDTTCYDVTALPDAMLETLGDAVLMDASQPVDALADAYGTIGYEVLTAIGVRVQRHYTETSDS